MLRSLVGSEMCIRDSRYAYKCLAQRVIQYSHVSIRTHRSIVCVKQCSNDHSVLSRQHMYSTVKCIVHSSCHDYVCSLVTKFAHFWSPRSTLCISSKPGLRVLLGDQICAPPVPSARWRIYEHKHVCEPVVIQWRSDPGQSLRLSRDLFEHVHCLRLPDQPGARNNSGNGLQFQRISRNWKR